VPVFALSLAPKECFEVPHTRGVRRWEVTPTQPLPPRTSPFTPAPSRFSFSTSRICSYQNILFRFRAGARLCSLAANGAARVAPHSHPALRGDDAAPTSPSFTCIIPAVPLDLLSKTALFASRGCPSQLLLVSPDCSHSAHWRSVTQALGGEDEAQSATLVVRRCSSQPVESRVESAWRQLLSS